MSIFEKFLGGKKEKKLVPGFQEDPALEDIARQVNGMAQECIGLTMDGGKEDLEKARAVLKNTVAGESGDKLRQYLKPYLEIEQLPKDALDVSKEEYVRWYAASVLRGKWLNK